MGYRRFQIESGYTYTQAIGGDPTHDAHDLPELLVRYGVAERLELRLAWDEGFVFDRYTDRNSGRVVRDNGSTDLHVGFKYAISKQDQLASSISHHRFAFSARRRCRAEQSAGRSVGQLSLQLGVDQEALAELQHGRPVDGRVGRPLFAAFSVGIGRV